MQNELSFGEWLRKQRRALDLSRQAFANQIGCAEVTLRRIEGGTLKPSKELAGILLEKLGIPELERSQWISFARGLSGLPLQTLPSAKKPSSNLPAPLTTFVGREKEQLDLVRLLSKHRLITLTGPGGVGKTRLSLKIGEQILDDYADGVWLVEFAHIIDPLLIPRVTAIAIGLREEPHRPALDMLCDYLREKQILLILDNCEHLLDACTQLVDRLLKRCPTLKILATSREVLGILGEATYPVPSLALPHIEQLVETFREYESIRLFEERAQLAQMDFSLTIENAPSVAKICSRLDGIPLAIELAAARVRTFSVEQIEERLQKSFRLLTTGNRTALPRHQTLQATIDWSYDLLSPAEQTLFRRLSIFVNGWTLEAAKSICSDGHLKAESILDLLIQLINKSLVFNDETQAEARYRMLETVRQYADDKLTESGEKQLLRDRHLDYFLTLAETAEPHLIRPEQIEWLPVLDADYENLRIAFKWSLNKDTAALALKLCMALGWFWNIRCYWSEGLSWVKRALAKPSQSESMSEKAARARALSTQADLEWRLGNFEQIVPPARSSLALALNVSGKKDIAIARFYMGVALRGEDSDQALSLMEQSLSEFEALQEEFWQAFSLPYLSEFLATQSKLKYDDLILRSLELARKAGERLVLADVLLFYAVWLLRTNRLDEARERAEESDRIYKQIGFQSLTENSFVFAEIAWAEGNTPKACSLYTEMLERYRLLGEKLFRSICTSKLGILAMEENDLDKAQTYLEQALMIAREAGYKRFIAGFQTELCNLFYRRENLEAFKQNFREVLSLNNYFIEPHKIYILVIILGSLYFQKPESSARLLGVIHNHERENYFLHTPLDKRYCARAETHARKTLSEVKFAAAFAEGQKMSLDEALDLALKTVEEI